MPALPSLSLPQPRDASGPVPLPPLPEEPPAPSTLPGSSDPCATPQSRQQEESKKVDPDSIKAGLFPDSVDRVATGTDEDGKLTLSVVIQKKLPELPMPSGTDVLQAAKWLSAALKFSADPSDRSWLEDIKVAVSGASTPKDEGRAEPKSAKSKKSGKPRSAQGETQTASNGGMWTPARPNVLRFPLSGATIEIRVSPVFRNAGSGRTEAKPAPDDKRSGRSSH
jgi:hypothetical protein